MNAKPGPIFSAESITATLKRRKILTTRVIDLAKFKGIEVNGVFMDLGVRLPPFTTPSDCPAVRGRFVEDGQHGVWHFKLPYEVGKVYYVRERWLPTLTLDYDPEDGTTEYPLVQYQTMNGDLYHNMVPDADPFYAWELRQIKRGGPQLQTWQNPIFMPRFAARLFIEITSIRIGRLHEMTEQDYIDEGCPGAYLLGSNWWQAHWDSINKKRGFPWTSNPWRVSYGYKMVERPVSI